MSCECQTRFIPLEGGQCLPVVVQKWLQRKRRVRLPDREPTRGVSQRPVRDTNFICRLRFACHDRARQTHAEIQQVPDRVWNRLGFSGHGGRRSKSGLYPLLSRTIDCATSRSRCSKASANCSSSAALIPSSRPRTRQFETVRSTSASILTASSLSSLK
jgi:hypothetical protein